MLGLDNCLMPNLATELDKYSTERTALKNLLINNLINLLYEFNSSAFFQQVSGRAKLHQLLPNGVVSPVDIKVIHPIEL